MKNWSYTIKEGEHKGTTLWSGRYCAVCGLVFWEKENHIYVLANKRGKGTPDYQGYWNLPCGYLEADESGKQGISREIKEECGYDFSPSLFDFYTVQTEPELCNNSNVTLFYEYWTNDPEFYKIEASGGEQNEVECVMWIDINQIDNFKWAFGHDRILKYFKEAYGNK